ncbi:16S rRNA (cytosine(967)-C(5))-methyltransferase [Geitlerinema sp. PCC 7407]|uniref:16S rRNA (cytosine(967)-C(5))-methyltransferase n=1 Tax=Geitlerinema sp. PCC 7407 TaxID=1173025 RepID=UPI00029F8CA8|nr:16S rRNA (cytosine(967)-C(5))-methyltransferase [Geitlerinema sp. PCC 7407]AFY64871.1 sun protein [Geitlerinema sp. PCC 7407]
MSSDARQLAFQALRAVQRGGYADVVLDRLLRQADLQPADRRLATELVYGSVRQQRTLDALVDQLGTKRLDQQPPDLRFLMHLGLYQLRYLSQVPAAAAVNTTVEIAKHNRLGRLAAVVNGMLRQYLRLAAQGDPLQLPADPLERLAVQYSYPTWILEVWRQQLDDAGVEQLCQALNQPPPLDLRVNLLRSTPEAVQTALAQAGIVAEPVPGVPQALRLQGSPGTISELPGFKEGWWTVQDSSAQLVSQVLDPRPGETVIDACAAPGGKTTHLAELMGDRGTIWACDRYPSRLRKVTQNLQRLGLQSVRLQAGDSRDLSQFRQQADRVLVDAPCSGLGTLNRHADARWRQTPDTARELAALQQEILAEAATWVKPQGHLVYATCTLNPLENESVVTAFLQAYPEWAIAPLPEGLPGAIAPEGWLKLWPHLHRMDGFFIAALRRQTAL